jgi:hypothetical protein
MPDSQLSPPKKTRLSTSAGIFSIIAGCMKLLVAFGLAIATIGVLTGEEEKDAVVVLLAIAVPVAVLGIVAVTGGIFALVKKNWGMSLAGAIAAVLPFSLVGIVALVLTALSREEFE